MDSHGFRIVGQELLRALDGALLGKIHGPHDGVAVFNLFAKGMKLRLVLRHERRYPMLFVTSRHIENPPRPPEPVMRLRKYAGDKRLGAGYMDFPGRRLAFPVMSSAGAPEVFLLLDMARGAFVVPRLPGAFNAPPLWPDASLVGALCGMPWLKGEREGPWREYALLTPVLRETLATMEPLEGRALMVDLESGGGDLFLYGDKQGRPVSYAAWPLPPELCTRRGLEAAPLAVSGEMTPALAARLCGEAGTVLPERLLAEFPALLCASLADEPRFFNDLGERARKEDSLPLRKASKKNARLLATLEREEKRLAAMLELRNAARRIQAELWRYPADARLPELRVAGEDGREEVVPLDPLLSMRENMARMFKQSARGQRGLAMLRERKESLLQETGEEGVAGERPAAVDVRKTALPLAASSVSSGAEEAVREGPRLVEEPHNAVKDVVRYMSSDGFVLLRGKNARGNQQLLKIGKGHDLWMHAQDGPSAHLIIRRAHAMEEVPERTLLEAARLVGEKSWQRHDAKASVMVALVRHVHPVKGGAPGSVRVGAVLRSLVVPLAL